ncbi:hypothetical protein ABTX34_11225 [Streptomyces sp. NPDC096538]|uniref:hypothetical protein n=1 Tax=Streptomyces sp. NPDC096538 TaxID=3155427 RepID=UPI003323F4B2
MKTRATACAALLALAALTGCSSGSDDKPEQPEQPAATVTKTLDTAAARKACVDAWAELLQGDEDLGLEDEPSTCQGLPEDDRIDRYMDGLAQRNQANRDEVQACLDDPACTSVPIP